jgi:cyanate permease
LHLVADRRIFYGWIVVAAAFVQMGVGYGLVYSLGNYLEPFSREFGTSRASASFVFGLTAILSLTGGALAGPLADRFGQRALSATIGAVYTGAGLGSLLGPWLGGLAFDRTGSYRLANLGAAVAALAAAAAAAQVGRRRPAA